MIGSIISVLNWADTDGFNFLILLMIASSFVLVVSFCISWLFSKSSASNRFSVWQATFIALAAIPLGACLLPNLPLGLGVDSAKQELESVEQRHSSLANVLEKKFSNLNETHSFASPTAQPSFNRPADLTTAHNTQRYFESGVSSVDSLKIASAIKKSSDITWRSVMVLGWLLGIAIGFASLIWTYRQARGIVCRANPISDNVLNSQVSTQLLISEEIEIPVTTGAFNPRILLPAKSSDWTNVRTRLVLMHEQAHVERRDVVWQSFTGFVSTLFWFQPLVWLADSQMKIERERACDDQVLRRGETASDYAQVLLDFAAELSGKSPRLFGALSMAQKPIEKRMITILDGNTNRSPSTRLVCASLICLLVSLATFVSVLRPWSPIPAAAVEPAISSVQVSANPEIATSDQAAEDAQSVEGSAVKQDDDANSTVEMFALPETLTGFVFNESKIAVANASVEMTLISPLVHSDSFRGSKMTKLKIVHTDENGQYKLDTKGLMVNANRTLIRGIISKAKYLDNEITLGISKGKPITLPNTKLHEGRRITGRVVAPTGQLASVQNPRIQIFADSSSHVGRWQSRMTKCGSGGEFEAWVPKTGRVEVEATSQNYAGVKTYVAPTDTALGEIKLAVGTSYYGTVRQQDGTPVADAIVKLSGVVRTDISTPLSYVFQSIPLADKTNAEGRYHLPPFVGDCRIYVDYMGKTTGSNEWLISKIRPVILPRVIRSSPIKKAELDLVVGETSKVSGTIKWKDGAPAANVQVRAFVMTGGSGVDVDEAYTNGAGEYQVEFPINTPDDQGGLMVIGAIDKNKVSNVAYVKPKEGCRSHGSQGVNFKTLSADISGVDWDLRVRDKPKIHSTHSPHKRTKADLVLSEIGTRFYRNRATANIPDLTKELVQLESDYRGDFAAVMAIHQALQWSIGFWPEPADPRVTLLEILQKHYVKHQDLDLCLRVVLKQQYDPKGLDVLTNIQNQSPHIHVRAEACYLQAEHLSRQLAHYKLFKARDWKFDLKTPSEYSAAQQKRIADGQREMLDVYRSLDVLRVREKVDELAKTIRGDYADVVRSGIISPVESFNYSRHSRKKTYAQLIEPIYFELEKLQVGMTVPEVEGLGVTGQPFKLSKLRGKVVVLFFTKSWYSDRQKAFYAKFAKLKEKYGEAPFEIVTVITEPGEEWAKAPVEKGWVTWPTYWDKDSILLGQWHIRGLPSDLFLIDARGEIQNRLSGADDSLLPKSIEELIEKAKASK